MHLRNFITSALAVLLAACGSCSSNEAAIALARSLSQVRLAQLVRDLGALGPSRPDQGRIYFDARSGIPAAFADLHPQSITADGDTARVHLAGCVDDKVLLIVHGLSGSGRREVVLLPGEAKESAVLWQSN